MGRLNTALALIEPHYPKAGNGRQPLGVQTRGRGAPLDGFDWRMFFATLECELLDRCRFKTQVEARMAVFAFIEGWYNPHRRHSALDHRRPIHYETTSVERASNADRERDVLRTSPSAHAMKGSNHYNLKQPAQAKYRL